VREGRGEAVRDSLSRGEGEGGDGEDVGNKLPAVVAEGLGVPVREAHN